MLYFFMVTMSKSYVIETIRKSSVIGITEIILKLYCFRTIRMYCHWNNQKIYTITWTIRKYTVIGTIRKFVIGTIRMSILLLGQLAFVHLSGMTVLAFWFDRSSFVIQALEYLTCCRCTPETWGLVPLWYLQ